MGNALRFLHIQPVRFAGFHGVAIATGFEAAALGQVHDLVVVGHPSDPDDPDHSLTSDALFGTGGPGLKGLKRRLRPPRVDETLYEL